MSCLNSDIFCTNGICNSDTNSCTCFRGWFGATCDDKFTAEYLNSFIALRITFIVIYSLILLSQIYMTCCRREFEAYFEGAKHKLSVHSGISPKHIIQSLTIFSCLVKILWLSIDPFNYNPLDYWPGWCERLSAELPNATIYSLFATILYIWFSLTEQIILRRQAAIQYNKVEKSKSDMKLTSIKSKDNSTNLDSSKDKPLHSFASLVIGIAKNSILPKV